MEKSALGPGREFDLIRQFLQSLPEHDALIVGPGDDCAVLADGFVISTDASVEGVHFRRDWLTAEEIGYRAAAVALSDLAAVAATPRAILTSFVLPRADYGDFAVRVMTGVRRAAVMAGAALAGGDTSAIDGPMVIDVTVVGHTAKPVLRSGARPGDHVFVTGELGGAAAAVAAWRHGEQPTAEARRRYALPHPRIEEASWLAQRIDLHALIDLSDGLASDAAHLAAASNCGVRLHMNQLPIQRAAGANAQWALSGGDDYELCFTAEQSAATALAPAFQERFGLRITDVGEVTAEKGLLIVNEAGEVLAAPPALGWNHFGERA